MASSMHSKGRVDPAFALPCTIVVATCPLLSCGWSTSARPPGNKFLATHVPSIAPSYVIRRHQGQGVLVLGASGVFQSLAQENFATGEMSPCTEPLAEAAHRRR
eukprot:scaffold17179_cov28-Tisochrysis_lutea.AAC.2